MTIGVIADTHHLLRPEARKALAGVNRIIHAGDVGDYRVIEELETLAPVTAIRGNIDVEGKSALLPDTAEITANGRRIFVIHDVHDLAEGAAQNASVVIAGHSHKPRNEWRRGVLWFNPGAAGPRRFSLPVALGRLEFGKRFFRAFLIKLI